ncbi:MAG: hypothetical protein ACLP8S_09415 [Solirubrobacteraceae bacterium]
MKTRVRPRAGALIGGLICTTALAGLSAVLLIVLLGSVDGAACPAGSSSAAGAITVGPPGSGQLVGATEYGGPGDPSSGTTGSSGANLLAAPDSYAELGGFTFQTATAMGGLPYMTPLRITWGGRSVVAYKRDIGLGGGPIDGRPRVIDLWWELAGALRIPYEDGLWSGLVTITRAAQTGAASVLGDVPSVSATLVSAPGSAAAPVSAECQPLIGRGVPLTPGSRATLLPSGLAAAPADAPAAVKGIIAAGNQIAGKPYGYGGGHGLPLDEIAPAYDCSSSVDHLLYGGGLLPVTYDGTAIEFESFGEPGPGRWVTILASADHVFMYVAGLRWDTHNAAGPGDGSTGIGWHPLVREAAGFVVRHPVGL